MGTQDRLAALSSEIAEVQTEIGVLQEQLVFVSEVAEDARIRSVVSETPLADREYREARDDAERTTRSLEEAQARLAKLRSEQDSLLERLLDDPSGSSGGS